MIATDTPRTMATPAQVLKSGIQYKLVPFFKTLVIYFVVFIPCDEPSLWAALLKALPILSLMAFVVMNGINMDADHWYARRILAGLLFSVAGDVLLVWDEWFLHGLVAFLVAQILYISAFGFKPLKWPVALVCYSILLAGLAMIVPGADAHLKIGLTVYGVTVMTMVWRAVARVSVESGWSQLCASAGGMLFAFSDTCIGVNAFYATIPYSQAVIMSTYYLAQLGISLSVVDSKAAYHAIKRARD